MRNKMLHISYPVKQTHQKKVQKRTVILGVSRRRPLSNDFAYSLIPTDGPVEIQYPYFR